ncbi:hypothetical protein C9415_22520 [Kluyvera sp. Nf5]|nr:hypothetical protein C9415_22520 [Kluyvera sp. Nf5]
MNDTEKEIGVRIKERRLELHMTQKTLASAVDVSMAAVSLWEKGESIPSSSRIEALASALKCSVKWLLVGEEMSTDEFGEKIPDVNKQEMAKIQLIFDLLPEDKRKEVMNFAQEKLMEHFKNVERELLKFKGFEDQEDSR